MDLFHLVGGQVQTQVFRGQGTGAFQVWNKPKRCGMVMMYVLGSGGGGGGGFTRIAGAAGGGGGGGGSGALSRVLFPAYVLPDRLFVRVGIGGRGAPGSGSPGSSGELSYVSAVDNSILQAVLYAVSGNAAATGGGAGTGAAAGGAGSASSASTAATQALSPNGVWTTIIGQNGAAGGAQTGANGGSLTILAAYPMMGGSGGGGTTSGDFNGGNQTSPLTTWIGTLSGGLAASTLNGVPGYDFTRGNTPHGFFSTGGTGGCARNSAAGGFGGEGGTGSGGGGGGAGTTGGAGGKGGDGLVIITAW